MPFSPRLQTVSPGSDGPTFYDRGKTCLPIPIPPPLRITPIIAALLLSGCTTFTSHIAEAAEESVEQNRLIVAQLDDYFNKAAMAGFNGAVLFERNGDVILKKAYGWQDREAKLPSSIDTVYPIGSVQKQFTAAAVLKLASQNKLNLNDPITEYFSGVPADKADITLHHLLTHTSGLPNTAGRCTGETTRQSYAASVMKMTLQGKPGQSYSYSNSGYNLASAIVEQVSGQGFEQYLREQIWLPLGMKETGVFLPAWPRQRLAIGYRKDNRWGTMFEKVFAEEKLPVTNPNGRRWCGLGTGATLSTLGDLHSWYKAVRTGTALPPQPMKQLLSPQVAEKPGPTPTSWYGYGLTFFQRPGGKRILAHNGGVIDIYAANFVQLIDERSGYIILSNPFSEGQNAIELSAGAQRILTQSPNLSQ